MKTVASQAWGKKSDHEADIMLVLRNQTPASPVAQGTVCQIGERQLLQADDLKRR
jgi:hypothetical protein